MSQKYLLSLSRFVEEEERDFSRFVEEEDEEEDDFWWISSSREEEEEGLGWISDEYDEGFGWISEDEEEEDEEALEWISRFGLSWSPVQDSSKTSSERSLYLRIAEEEVSPTTRTTHIHWYAITADELKGSPLPPSTGGQLPDELEGTMYRSLPQALRKLPSDVPFKSKAVVLFPRIYLLGGVVKRDGRYHEASDVFSYDVNSPERGWVRRCSMICPRNHQSVYPLDGKIYVFGGLKYDPEVSQTFGEVYDAELDTWEALPSPVSDSYVDLENSSDSNCNGLDLEVDQVQAMFIDKCSNKKHLFLHTRSNGCLTYDVSAASLTQHNHMLNQCGRHRPSAVVDGILYTFRPDEIKIYGYDMVHGERFSGPVRGLTEGLEVPSFRIGHTPSILDIGSGRLCILWHSTFDVQRVMKVKRVDIVKRVTYVHIRCSVVRVARFTSSDGKQRILHALVEFHKDYAVPGYSLEEGCFVF